jgi:predicted lactoylglutathione lyase
MPKMIFVNLPVKDLAAATRFYEAIGCEKNAQFSNGDAAMMVWSDTIAFMLLRHEFFSTFTPRPIADAKTATRSPHLPPPLRGGGGDTFARP